MEESIKEDKSKKEPPLPNNPPPVGKLNKAGYVKVLPSQKYFKKQNFTISEKSGKDVVEDSPPLRVTPAAPSPKPVAVIEKVAQRTPSNKDAKKSVKKPVALVHVMPPVVPEVEKPMPKPVMEHKPAEVIQKSEDILPSMLTDTTFSVDLSPSNDPNIPKTGFDFLDDW